MPAERDRGDEGIDTYYMRMGFAMSDARCTLGLLLFSGRVEGMRARDARRAVSFLRPDSSAGEPERVVNDTRRALGLPSDEAEIVQEAIERTTATLQAVGRGDVVVPDELIFAYGVVRDLRLYAAQQDSLAAEMTTASGA